MPTKDEALKMAIEALETISHKITKWTDGGKWTDGEEALNACKEALESQEIGDAEIRQMLNDIEYYQKRVEELDTKQVCENAAPAQEPVAWMYRGNLHEFDPSDWATEPVIPLYTHPAQPLNKTAERDYNFMRDLAIGAEELLSKTIKELDEVKELLAQRNLELIEARYMLLNKHME